MALVKYNNNSISAVTSAASVPSGAMTLIKTLTADEDSTLAFVNGASDVVLDSTYPIYLVKCIGIHPSNNEKHFQFNGSDDTSSHSYNITKTTTVFAAHHYEDDSQTNLRYSTGNDIAQGTGFQNFNNEDFVGNDNDQNIVVELYLFNPSSTTFVKHFIARSMTNTDQNVCVDNYIAGYFNTTAAITALQFKMSANNIDTGTLKLYGIKDS